MAKSLENSGSFDKSNMLVLHAMLEQELSGALTHLWVLSQAFIHTTGRGSKVQQQRQQMS